MTDEATDRDLMARIQSGDHEAYHALYERWSRQVFRFLLRRTGSRAAAEEAIQETWLRMYRSRRSYDPKWPFPSWLFRIAVNAGHDAWRPEPEVFHLTRPAPERPDLRNQLVQALHLLGPLERRMLLLAVEGFTSKEIATMLDTSPGAVRMRISRARAQLREVLGGAHV